MLRVMGGQHDIENLFSYSSSSSLDDDDGGASSSSSSSDEAPPRSSSSTIDTASVATARRRQRLKPATTPKLGTSAAVQASRLPADMRRLEREMKMRQQKEHELVAKIRAGKGALPWPPVAPAPAPPLPPRKKRAVEEVVAGDDDEDAAAKQQQQQPSKVLLPTDEPPPPLSEEQLQEEEEERRGDGVMMAQEVREASDDLNVVSTAPPPSPKPLISSWIDPREQAEHDAVRGITAEDAEFGSDIIASGMWTSDALPEERRARVEHQTNIAKQLERGAITELHTRVPPGISVPPPGGRKRKRDTDTDTDTTTTTTATRQQMLEEAMERARKATSYVHCDFTGKRRMDTNIPPEWIVQSITRLKEYFPSKAAAVAVAGQSPPPPENEAAAAMAAAAASKVTKQVGSTLVLAHGKLADVLLTAKQPFRTSNMPHQLDWGERSLYGKRGNAYWLLAAVQAEEEAEARKLDQLLATTTTPAHMRQAEEQEERDAKQRRLLCRQIAARAALREEKKKKTEAPPTEQQQQPPLATSKGSESCLIDAIQQQLVDPDTKAMVLDQQTVDWLQLPPPETGTTTTTTMTHLTQYRVLSGVYAAAAAAAARGVGVCPKVPRFSHSHHHREVSKFLLDSQDGHMPVVPAVRMVLVTPNGYPTTSMVQRATHVLSLPLVVHWDRVRHALAGLVGTAAANNNNKTRTSLLHIQGTLPLPPPPPSSSSSVNVAAAACCETLSFAYTTTTTTSSSSSQERPAPCDEPGWLLAHKLLPQEQRYGWSVGPLWLTADEQAGNTALHEKFVPNLLQMGNYSLHGQLHALTALEGSGGGRGIRLPVSFGSLQLAMLMHMLNMAEEGRVPPRQSESGGGGDGGLRILDVDARQGEGMMAALILGAQSYVGINYVWNMQSVLNDQLRRVREARTRKVGGVRERQLQQEEEQQVVVGAARTRTEALLQAAKQTVRHWWGPGAAREVPCVSEQASRGASLLRPAQPPRRSQWSLELERDELVSARNLVREVLSLTIANEIAEGTTSSSSSMEEEEGGVGGGGQTKYFMSRLKDITWRLFEDPEGYPHSERSLKELREELRGKLTSLPSSLHEEEEEQMVITHNLAQTCVTSFVERRISDEWLLEHLPGTRGRIEEIRGQDQERLQQAVKPELGDTTTTTPTTTTRTTTTTQLMRLPPEEREESPYEVKMARKKQRDARIARYTSQIRRELNAAHRRVRQLLEAILFYKTKKELLLLTDGAQRAAVVHLADVLTRARQKLDKILQTRVQGRHEQELDEQMEEVQRKASSSMMTTTLTHPSEEDLREGLSKTVARYMKQRKDMQPVTTTREPVVVVVPPSSSWFASHLPTTLNRLRVLQTAVRTLRAEAQAEKGPGAEEEEEAKEGDDVAEKKRRRRAEVVTTVLNDVVRVRHEATRRHRVAAPVPRRLTAEDVQRAIDRWREQEHMWQLHQALATRRATLQNMLARKLRLVAFDQKLALPLSARDAELMLTSIIDYVQSKRSGEMEQELRQEEARMEEEERRERGGGVGVSPAVATRWSEAKLGNTACALIQEHVVGLDLKDLLQDDDLVADLVCHGLLPPPTAGEEAQAARVAATEGKSTRQQLQTVWLHKAERLLAQARQIYTKLLSQRRAAVSSLVEDALAATTTASHVAGEEEEDVARWITVVLSATSEKLQTLRRQFDATLRFLQQEGVGGLPIPEGRRGRPPLEKGTAELAQQQQQLPADVRETIQSFVSELSDYDLLQGETPVQFQERIMETLSGDPCKPAVVEDWEPLPHHHHRPEAAGGRGEGAAARGLGLGLGGGPVMASTAEEEENWKILFTNPGSSPAALLLSGQISSSQKVPEGFDIALFCPFTCRGHLPFSIAATTTTTTTAQQGDDDHDDDEKKRQRQQQKQNEEAWKTFVGPRVPVRQWLMGYAWPLLMASVRRLRYGRGVLLVVLADDEPPRQVDGYLPIPPSTSSSYRGCVNRTDTMYHVNGLLPPLASPPVPAGEGDEEATTVQNDNDRVASARAILHAWREAPQQRGQVYDLLATHRDNYVTAHPFLLSVPLVCALQPSWPMLGWRGTVSMTTEAGRQVPVGVFVCSPSTADVQSGIQLLTSAVCRRWESTIQRHYPLFFEAYNQYKHTFESTLTTIRERKDAVVDIDIDDGDDGNGGVVTVNEEKEKEKEAPLPSRVGDDVESLALSTSTQEAVVDLMAEDEVVESTREERTRAQLRGRTPTASIVVQRNAKEMYEKIIPFSRYMEMERHPATGVYAGGAYTVLSTIIQRLLTRAPFSQFSRRLEEVVVPQRGRRRRGPAAAAVPRIVHFQLIKGHDHKARHLLALAHLMCVNVFEEAFSGRVLPRDSVYHHHHDNTTITQEDDERARWQSLTARWNRVDQEGDAHAQYFAQVSTWPMFRRRAGLGMRPGGGAGVGGSRVRMMVDIDMPAEIREEEEKRKKKKKKKKKREESSTSSMAATVTTTPPPRPPPSGIWEETTVLENIRRHMMDAAGAAIEHNRSVGDTIAGAQIESSNNNIRRPPWYERGGFFRIDDMECFTESMHLTLSAMYDSSIDNINNNDGILNDVIYLVQERWVKWNAPEAEKREHTKQQLWFESLVEKLGNLRAKEAETRAKIIRNEWYKRLRKMSYDFAFADLILTGELKYRGGGRAGETRRRDDHHPLTWVKWCEKELYNRRLQWVEDGYSQTCQRFCTIKNFMWAEMTFLVMMETLAQRWLSSTAVQLKQQQQQKQEESKQQQQQQQQQQQPTTTEEKKGWWWEWGEPEKEEAAVELEPDPRMELDEEGYLIVYRDVRRAINQLKHEGDEETDKDNERKRRVVNPYEGFTLSRGTTEKYMNRAALKLEEIDALTHVIREKWHADEWLPAHQLMFADVCGGPGAFTQYVYMTYHRTKHSSDTEQEIYQEEGNDKTRDRAATQLHRNRPDTVFGRAITLRSSLSTTTATTATTTTTAAAAAGSSCGWAQTQKGRRSQETELARIGVPAEERYVVYGETNTGDITDVNNIRALGAEFCVKYGHAREPGCTIMTADGGQDISADWDAQERAYLDIIRYECVAAAVITRCGGNFVLKIQDVMRFDTIALLYALSLLFNTIQLVKPLTSRPANSEKYVVCKDRLAHFGSAPLPFSHKLVQLLLKPRDRKRLSQHVRYTGQVVAETEEEEEEEDEDESKGLRTLFARAAWDEAFCKWLFDTTVPLYRRQCDALWVGYMLTRSLRGTAAAERAGRIWKQLEDSKELEQLKKKNKAALHNMLHNFRQGIEDSRRDFFQVQKKGEEEEKED